VLMWGDEVRATKIDVRAGVTRQRGPTASPRGWGSRWWRRRAHVVYYPSGDLDRATPPNRKAPRCHSRRRKKTIPGPVPFMQRDGVYAMSRQTRTVLYRDSNRSRGIAHVPRGRAARARRQ
jgi:hypothetical protein